MQHPETIADTLERVTTKQRSSVQREVVRLLDELVPQRSVQTREEVMTSTRMHRWPSRCILQNEERAVSVSWFPPRADQDALGEILLIAWEGTVSLPGSAERARTEAVARKTVVITPVEEKAGGWAWRTDGGASLLDTAAVAKFCRQMLH